MANTKETPRTERKTLKRAARKAFKAKLSALTYKERKEMRKHEGTDSEFLQELADRKAGGGDD